MKLRFYQRLALVLVVAFTFIVGVLYAISSCLQTQTYDEAQQRLHVSLAAHLVDDNPLLKDGVYHYEALKNLFHTLMILGPGFEFYFLSPQGDILTYSAKPGDVVRDSVSLAPINTLIGTPQGMPVYGDDPRQLHGQKVFSAAPVYQGEQLQGYLYVIIGSQQYDSILSGTRVSHGWQQWLLVFGGSAVFLLVCLLVLFRWLTAPLRQLNDAMEQASAEGFAGRTHRQLIPWQRDSHHEVHRLGCAFNDLLSRLDEQFSALQQVDEQRRALLADLSHDLRTPLASLQGYIETLSIRGNNLTEQERNQFVDICLRHANNLKRLIDQIFELAYLEGGQVTLNRETFPIAELVQDVVAKFALLAEQKGITLRVAPDASDTVVFADIGKLERVLTNLIDNALRHTPRGGEVCLHLTANERSMRIDIRDNGVGISDNEIAFIFDARYQAANHKTDNALHAGLGLAICRNLISLLEGTLRVESELGKGTCFSFDVPRAQTL
ncbi:HAMP domain-containing histidine kinase [Aestuariibacter halophilus]|uniref:histidine kinase n=1 Tax=Fluctibacter halophilus TaxID=226011 RepID=A0ABS8G9J0_9ALTE|nr:HAMP domain-containing sensor histidine kinase [Aestuariibacter halophilus]MCC2617210.1 HAMP domain-containing histidine kinase [Aestuariibacter halophilus]